MNARNGALPRVETDHQSLPCSNGPTTYESLNVSANGVRRLRLLLIVAMCYFASITFLVTIIERQGGQSSALRVTAGTSRSGNSGVLDRGYVCRPVVGLPVCEESSGKHRKASPAGVQHGQKNKSLTHPLRFRSSGTVPFAILYGLCIARGDYGSKSLRFGLPRRRDHGSSFICSVFWL